MRGLARILLNDVPQGAGFLFSPTRLYTCAHVVNLALDRDKHCLDRPDPDATVVLDFPNDLSEMGGTSTRPRRIGRIVAWHPPTLKDQVPGKADEIAVLALDQPMPDASVPALYPADLSLDDRTEINGWGTPRHSPDGLWARATLSGFQGPLRQVNLEDTGPELQLGFSGGPLCAQPDDHVIGMMIAVNESRRAAWLLPIEALRAVWDELQVLTVHVRVDSGQLYAQPHGPTQGTALAWLSEKAEQENGSALLNALFAPNAWGSAGPLAGISRPGAVQQAADAAVDWAPPRLRIRCADVDSADLPWHIVADADANGTRLGETGWIIEVTGPTPSEAITVEIDTPLILAPGSSELADAVHSHVGEVAAALAPLLTHHQAKVSWAVNALDLDDALGRKHPPDLVYCYARLAANDELVLGRDDSSREGLALTDLFDRLRGTPSSPQLLWLHLVSENGATRARRLILEQTRAAGIQLCVLQVTTNKKIGVGLNRTVKALEALAECRNPSNRPGHCRSGFAEPAAVISRFGTSGTRAWLRCNGLRLSAAPNEGEWNRNLIRASLIPHLLGRINEKRLLAATVHPTACKLVLYHVCGERQACVHDFPYQGRGHLEDVVPGLTVRQTLIPGRMHPNQDADELEDQLVEALGYDPAKKQTVGDALRQLARRQPNDGETLVVSLAWLLEPTDSLSADAAIEWLGHWKQTLVDLFTPAEIPEYFLVLAGVCLQWRAASSGGDWPSRAGTTATKHQERAADLLDRRRRPHCDWVGIKTPLDQLEQGELETFFQTQLEKGRLCMRGLDAYDLADWVWARTEGRFELTVDLIYDACKQHFAEVRRDGGAAAATPGATQ